MLRLKKLTLKQKKFLVKQKMDPEKFLLERTTPESYIFYEKESKRLVEVRRWWNFWRRKLKFYLAASVVNGLNIRLYIKMDLGIDENTVIELRVVAEEG